MRSPDRTPGRLVRAVLARRHVVYAAVAAGFLTLLAAEFMTPWAGAGLVLTATVWAAEFQTRSLRRRRADAQRLQAVQKELTAVRKGLESQAVAVARMSVVAEQARAAAEAARAPLVPARAGAGRPKVLFVTSNGSGMGHLTRLTAVANAGRGRFESSFLSLSSAAEIVTRFGYPVVRVASQSTSELGWPEWNRRFARVVRARLEAEPPDVIVFDGIQVFRGLYEAAADAGIPLVWVCRGLWKPHVPVEQLRRWRDVSSAVVVPTERPLLADDTAVPTDVDGIHAVDPVVLLDPADILGRSDARDRLELGADRRYVLIQLGASPTHGRRELEAAAIDAVRALGSEWEPIVFRSPLSRESGETVAGARMVREYPMSALLQAFDFSITSSGYNTVHENVRFGQPAIYVPDLAMLADDQERRAHAMVERGLGLAETTADMLASAVREIAEPGRLERMRDLLSGVHVGDGAQAIADVIMRSVADDGPRLLDGLECEEFNPVEMGVQ